MARRERWLSIASLCSSESRCRNPSVAIIAANAAKNIILLITGADKSQAVADLLGQDTAARDRLPAAGIETTNGMLAIVLDTAAAKLTDLKAESKG